MVRRSGVLVASLVLSLLLPGCGGRTTPEAFPPAPVEDDTHALQRASLGFALRAGAPLPPAPTRAEREAVARRLALADPAEAEELRSYYGDELDLLALATRDSDGDGVHDFRVSDYHGKLLEGDVDLDGDGVRNLLDAAPYDPARGGRDADGDGAPDAGTFGDENANGVPDAADWAREGTRPAAAARQRELFLRDGILLVDRSETFDDALSRSVYDVMTRILDDLPRERLAVESECLLVPEEDSVTNAMMISQTQTLVVYRSGLELAPLPQLGLLLHELAHGVQFSFDFQDLPTENRRVHFPAPTFLALMVHFGWDWEPLAPEEIPPPPALFTPHYLLLEPRYTWRGEPPEDWQAWLDALSEEVDDPLTDPRTMEAGIVGAYSLSNPFEWHSDSVLAYLFVEVERWVAAHPEATRARPEDVRRAAREAWPDFRYANLAPEVRRHFRRVLPLADEDLAYFVRTYLEPGLRRSAAARLRMPSSPPTSSAPSAGSGTCTPKVAATGRWSESCSPSASTQSSGTA